MRIKHFIMIITLALGIGLPAAALAGPETRCYAYGNANDLIYCLQGMQRSGTIQVRTAGMEPGTAQLYTIVATQNVAPPTVIPGGALYTVREPNPIALIGQIGANMMAAAAWAHNWRDGYIGAQGLYGAAYMMNYPW